MSSPPAPSASPPPLNPWDARNAFVASPPAAPTERPHLTFSYRMTRASDLRTDVSCVFVNPPFLAMFLGIPAFVALIAASILQAKVGPTAGTVGLVAPFALWFGGLAVAKTVDLRKDFPTPDAIREGVLYLTPDGCSRVTLGGKEVSTPWLQVTAVRRGGGGDVFIYHKVGTPILIPGDWLRDPSDADRIYAAAHALWKSSGTAWASVAPATAAPAPKPAPEFDLGV